MEKGMMGIIFLFLLTLFCYAGEDKISELQKALGKDYEIEHTITIKPKILSEKEREINDINLSLKDEKLARAISIATMLASDFDKYSNKTVIPLESAFRLVKIARQQYDRQKPKIPFIVFIKKVIDRKFACSKRWIKYYRDFL